jgi:hypothetical protein
MVLKMQNSNHKIQQALNKLLSLALPEGGFRYSETGPFSPEASAWAALALKASGSHLDMAERACRRLADIQQPDGSVSAVSGYTEAVWCTPLCILAWKSFQDFQPYIEAGIQFLLTFRGRHHVKAVDSPTGHDTSIVGWPWIADTHSWIEPTCYSLIVLKSSGYQDHPRTRQGVMMIMDRQLSAGGWNYGNTTVFGKELLPVPENTGQALCALSGMASENAVNKSLRYLHTSIRKVRTPMALAWMLQGLKMWSQLPEAWENLVIESLELQKRYGPYDTVFLSQLVWAYFSKEHQNEIL